jgi:hypothetical protein
MVPITPERQREKDLSAVARHQQQQQQRFLACQQAQQREFAAWQQQQQQDFQTWQGAQVAAVQQQTPIHPPPFQVLAPPAMSELMLLGIDVSEQGEGV